MGSPRRGLSRESRGLGGSAIPLVYMIACGIGRAKSPGSKISPKPGTVKSRKPPFYKAAKA